MKLFSSVIFGLLRNHLHGILKQVKSFSNYSFGRTCLRRDVPFKLNS